jgi:inner membrane protein
MDLSLLDRFNNWIKESVMIKLLSIGVLILILMIPSSLVEDLINERQARAYEVKEEVARKWASYQTLTGPILMIPFKKIETVKEWTAGVEHSRLVETMRKAYFVAENLTADGKVSHDVLHRGIFDVVVYDSKVKIDAHFGDINFGKWNIPDEQVMWNDAVLLVGVTDMQGIHEIPKITSGNTSFVSESAAGIGLNVGQQTTDYNGNPTHMDATGFVVPFDWKTKSDIVKDFSIELDLKGSTQLYFAPVGKNTSVTISGTWPSPSFDGKMLPITREVSDAGFTATWKVLSFNRPIADQWVDFEQSLGGNDFGVRLYIPADQYQQSMRTAKYCALIILLAFTALFLVEITRKVRIHPFQYILVGVALTIYYTLLLSISEHLGYNGAYAIASIATVVLVALYSTTFFRNKALVMLFASVMAFFYVFIFVIIQAEDFSLLIGSIGLFAIIAVVMYFSRNIRWYKEEAPTT